MGYKEFTSAFTVATAEAYREWIGQWLQGWEDAGWVRTADTGQIDLITVTPPTSATWPHFVMYRFDDAAQSTYPVFIKIEFGSTASIGAKANIRLSVGKGTDGAGNLFGVLAQSALGNQGGTSGASNTSSIFTHLASSGPGYIAFLAFIDDVDGNSATGTRAFSFIVERRRTPTGEPDGAGLMVVVDGQGHANRTLGSSLSVSSIPTLSARAINYVAGTNNESAALPSSPYYVQGVPLTNSTSLAAGGIGPVLPWVLIAPGIAPWQSCVLVTIPAGDTPAGVFETNLCGSPMSMRAIPPSNLHSAWGLTILPARASGTPNFNNYFSPAIRWEE